MLPVFVFILFEYITPVNAAYLWFAYIMKLKGGRMNAAYSAFAGGLSQTPVFASPLDRGRLFFVITRASK